MSVFSSSSAAAPSLRDPGSRRVTNRGGVRFPVATLGRMAAIGVLSAIAVYLAEAPIRNQDDRSDSLLGEHESGVESAVFDPTGRWLASVGADGSAKPRFRSRIMARRDGALAGAAGRVPQSCHDTGIFTPRRDICLGRDRRDDRALGLGRRPTTFGLAWSRRRGVVTGLLSRRRFTRLRRSRSPNQDLEPLGTADWYGIQGLSISRFPPQSWFFRSFGGGRRPLPLRST
jgi:hypothetical protein